MQNLPAAEVYERSIRYMPWANLVWEVYEYVSTQAPQDGKVLDLLCGPGSFITELHERRPDLTLMGVDADETFIAYAQERCPEAHFEAANAEKWGTEERFDLIVCTGGVHHLPDDVQEPFIQKISTLLGPGGIAVIGDPYISDYSDMQGRLKASAELGHRYLLETIKKNAPPDVIDVAVQILRNDVLLVEWKTSVKKRLAVLNKYFGDVLCQKVWPKNEEVEFGDYYFVLRR